MTSLNQKNLTSAVLSALLVLTTANSFAAADKTANAPDMAATQNKKSQSANKKQGDKPQQASEPAADEDNLDNYGIKGPTTIDLGTEGSLKLPAGMVFIPKDKANELMVNLGNGTDPNRYGLIVPETKDDEESDWAVDLSYVESGYIKDDDAKDWDAESMLNDLKAGNEEQNKVRQSKGMAEIETRGWIEKPQYDAATHRLIWSIDVYEKGSNTNPAVNYNTFQLGRKGFITLTLITDLSKIERLKPVARELLSNIEFNQGLRYADFNATTDKVAEYGLAALIGGVAAKKLGLLAVIGAFFVKFGKIIALAAVGLGAGLKGRFGRKKDK